MMTSFKNVLKSNITRKAKTREQYEEIIASWLLAGFLTEPEATELLAYLDEVYPPTLVTSE